MLISSNVISVSIVAVNTLLKELAVYVVKKVGIKKESDQLG